MTPFVTVYAKYRYCRLAGGMEVENNLDQRQRNVILNAYEAKHAGSSIVEEGSEEEESAAEAAARREKVEDDLGKKQEAPPPPRKNAL